MLSFEEAVELVEKEVNKINHTINSGDVRDFLDNFDGYCIEIMKTGKVDNPKRIVHLIKNEY
jgi:hypothetical protein